MKVELVVVRGHQQPVVNAFVHGVFDGFLDASEVEHHALGIQIAGQFQVDDPGLPHHAALGVQIGKVHHGQVFDEQGGHKLFIERGCKQGGHYSRSGARVSPRGL